MAEDLSYHIERRIVTGLILSTEYLEKIEPLIKIKFFKTEESKRVSNWCLKYFRKYKIAPNKEIKEIYFSKIEKLDNEVAGLIEDTLFSLDQEYKRFLNNKNQLNVELLLDDTERYFKKRQLQILIQEAQEELDNDNLQEATRIANEFEPVQRIKTKSIIPLSSPEMIRTTFEDQFNPLFSYGDTPLGNLVNRSLCRGCFTALLSQNKGGKSFTLGEMALKGVFNGNNIAFFQAGDMSEAQQMRRQGIRLVGKSDLPEYCGRLFIPVLDCAYNQNGECDLADCESDESPFENYTVGQLREEAEINNIKTEELKEIVEDYPHHKPCSNCIRGFDSKKYKNFKGTLWYKIRDAVEPLTWKEVYHAVKKRYVVKLKRLRMFTYGNETLDVSTMKQDLLLLDKEGFKVDIVIVDYMDIMAADADTKHLSIRDQEHKKYQRLRALSTDRNILVLGATQADAQSFNKRVLDKTNFSEDKRKLDHLTDLFGLNMTKEEKVKGIMRWNSIVSRESEGAKLVHVAHRLQIGKPSLFSFY